MFDGAYKSRANVSLRGSSRKEESKEALLAQTQQLRQQREQLRRQKQAAERILVFYRKRHACRETVQVLRGEWDTLRLDSPDKDVVVSALRRLMVVYNGKTDAPRLCRLAHRLVDPRFPAVQLDQHAFLARQLAHCSLDVLASATTAQGPDVYARYIPLLALTTFAQHSEDVRLLLFTLMGRHHSTMLPRQQQLQIIRYLFGHTAVAKLREQGLQRPLAAPIPEALEFLTGAAAEALEDADAGTVEVVANALLHNVLAIPLLPLRLTTEFARVASDLPLATLLPLWLAHLEHPQAAAIPPKKATAVLGNLISLIKIVSQRRLLAYNELCSYVAILALLLPRVPVNALIESTEKELTVADYLNDEDVDSDDEDDDDLHNGSAGDKMKVAPAFERVDPQIIAQVRELIDPIHLSHLRQLLLSSAASGPATVEPELAVQRGTIACCSLYITLCTRWPSLSFELLNQLVYSDWSQWILMLWRSVTVHPLWFSFQRDTTSTNTLLSDPSDQSKTLWSVFGLLVLCLDHILRALEDDEFHQHSSAWPAGMTLVDMTLTIKGMVWRLLRGDMTLPSESNIAGTAMTVNTFRVVVLRLFKSLYQRNTRRPFMADDQWLAGFDIIPHDINNSLIDVVSVWVGTETSAVNVRSMPDQKRELLLLQLLKYAPFMIPFEKRVLLFQRCARRSAGNINMFEAVRHHNSVRIRRNHILDDGFEQINSLGTSLRHRIRVQFIDEDGNEEAGVDGGGLFKEFVTSLIKEAFDTEKGLFSSTAAHQLYPNPDGMRLNPKYRETMAFLGRIFGKILLEGILVEVPFAHFFLNRILGRENHFDDLPSLDPDVYRNLLFVKKYTGDVKELGLDFSLVDRADGNKVVELVKNGRHVPVTNENCGRYAHLVSQHRLNLQIKSGTENFIRGLSDILNMKLLRMFSPAELQTLIGGVFAPIDLNDMRKHLTYAGEFSATHPTIVMFWEVFASLTEEQRGKLLRFVTSCSRPPLLGFSEIQPPLCIHSVKEIERLPTASTCFNLLKMPAYSSKSQLREKLLYAIESNSGFDLS